MLVSDFSKFILPEVIGCPDPLMEQAIRQTAFDFCDRTGAWDEVVDDALMAGIATYELPSKAGAVPLRARDVWINGVRIDNGRVSNSSVSISYNSATEFGSIAIRPTPQQDGELLVRVVYAPTMTAATLPDILLSRYEQAISSGTKAKLMLMPGVAWSSPQLAMAHRQTYEAAVVDARIEGIFDRVSGQVHIQPLKFA